MLDLDDARLAALKTVLEQSRHWGFLGPGPVEQHLRHALGYAPALGTVSRVLDLGSGGGVPGLVLALVLPETRFVLLDANVRRCAFLRSAVDHLALGERVEVAEGRAEDLARAAGLRHSFDAVVARSFGPPATVAECAAGFLKAGGFLLVSEPPEAQSSRWSATGLALLGLALGERLEAEGGTLQVIRVTEPCGEKYPRRNGVPAKRPLF